MSLLQIMHQRNEEELPQSCFANPLLANSALACRPCKSSSFICVGCVNTRICCCYQTCACIYTQRPRTQVQSCAHTSTSICTKALSYMHVSTCNSILLSHLIVAVMAAFALCDEPNTYIVGIAPSGFIHDNIAIAVHPDLTELAELMLAFPGIYHAHASHALALVCWLIFSALISVWSTCCEVPGAPAAHGACAADPCIFAAQAQFGAHWNASGSASHWQTIHPLFGLGLLSGN